MNRNAIGHIATSLLRQIGKVAGMDADDREKPILVVEAVRATDWASLTFVGQRHELDLRIDGEAGAVAAVVALLGAGIGDADISISRHFIAEIGAVAGDLAAPLYAGHISRRVRIDALVLED